jgi:DNA-binding transcriptional ArsR family regulator
MDADIATVAALIAEPARARMLQALGDARPLPASALAAEAGVSPQPASAHLARLREAGLITMEPASRHRYLHLAGPEVAEALESRGAADAGGRGGAPRWARPSDSLI